MEEKRIKPRMYGFIGVFGGILISNVIYYIRGLFGDLFEGDFWFYLPFLTGQILFGYLGA